MFLLRSCRHAPPNAAIFPSRLGFPHVYLDWFIGWHCHLQHTGLRPTYGFSGICALCLFTSPRFGSLSCCVPRCCRCSYVLRATDAGSRTAFAALCAFVLYRLTLNTCLPRYSGSRFAGCRCSAGLQNCRFGTCGRSYGFITVRRFRFVLVDCILVPLRWVRFCCCAVTFYALREPFLQAISPAGARYLSARLLLPGTGWAALLIPPRAPFLAPLVSARLPPPLSPLSLLRLGPARGHCCVMGSTCKTLPSAIRSFLNATMPIAGWFVTLPRAWRVLPLPPRYLFYAFRSVELFGGLRRHRLWLTVVVPYTLPSATTPAAVLRCHSAVGSLYRTACGAADAHWFV